MTTIRGHKAQGPHISDCYLDHAHEHRVLSRPAQMCHGEFDGEHITLVVETDEEGGAVQDPPLA